MVGGMKLSTRGVVVWLRGGSAFYKVLNEMGSAMSITPYYDTFTDDAGISFPVRTYDASVVDSEIRQRLVFYPLTGGNLLGNLYALGEICSKKNNYPEVYFKNAAGTALANFYVDTTSGGFADVKLKVFSSASTVSYFTFGKDGKLSCGSLALTTALPISSGGTGSTTASGALTNLGALPKSGGTITGSLIVNAITTSNYFQTDNEFVNLGEDQNGEYGIINLGNTNYGDWISLTCSATGKLAVNNKIVYTAGGTVIYSSTQPTGSTGMIWLKPV